MFRNARKIGGHFFRVGSDTDTRHSFHSEYGFIGKRPMSVCVQTVTRFIGKVTLTSVLLDMECLHPCFVSCCVSCWYYVVYLYLVWSTCHLATHADKGKSGIA